MYDIEPRQEIIDETRQELLADEVLSLTSAQCIIKKKEGITMYKNMPIVERPVDFRIQSDCSGRFFIFRIIK